MDALVTDVHIRTAVAGLRAFARGGLDVLALAPGRGAAGLWSRGAAERAVGPDATDDPRGFVDSVSRLAVEHGPLMVVAGWDAALDALLDAAADLPPEAVLPHPGPEVMDRLRDKAALPPLAEAAGLKTPGTIAAGRAGGLVADSVPTPAVVKPVTSGGALGSALVVDDREELATVLSGLPPSEEVLVQPYARGSLIGLAVVVSRDGRLTARFQQTAQRTWPPGAGGSSLALSVDPDEELAERTAHMLAAAGYWGLAQAQFLDSRDGPLLIDVNPRLYGSMPLALACGANLATAWHAVVVDGSERRPTPYRVGVTYRWLEADLSAALRGSPELLLRRAPYPRAGAMWAPDDPLPTAILGATAVAHRLRRRMPQRGGR